MNSSKIGTTKGEEKRAESFKEKVIIRSAELERASEEKERD